MKQPSSIQQIAENMRKGEKGRLIPTLEEGQVGNLSYHTQIYTFFTEIGGSTLLYTAPNWVTLRLTLETAGPVAISTSEDVQPVLSGRGILLITGVEKEIKLPRGDRLFIGAGTVDRVAVVIEPIPWLQTIAISIERGARSIVEAVFKTFRPRTTDPFKPEDKEVPCPPKRRPFFPKGKR